MLFTLTLAETPINWLGLALALVGLAVGWTILRFVLRLTLKIFAIGCLGLLLLTGGMFLWLYLT